jgi:hypothetical protein
MPPSTDGIEHTIVTIPNTSRRATDSRSASIPSHTNNAAAAISELPTASSLRGEGWKSDVPLNVFPRRSACPVSSSVRMPLTRQTCAGVGGHS